MNKEIFEEVAVIVSRLLGISLEKVLPESSLVDDLGAGSLDLILIIGAIENQFSLQISEEVVREMNTIGDIVDYVEN